MNSRTGGRTTLGIGLSLALALQIGASGIPLVHADMATPHLVFSEINWAGSAASPDDEWIEVFNPTSTQVNFSDTPYTISTGSTVLATLNSATIPSNGFVLISRQTPGSAQSTLSASTNAIIDPALVLPNVDTQYVLTNKLTNTVVDTAGQAMGLPLAGSDGTMGDHVIAAMARVASSTGMYADGTQSSSWFTPRTIGLGFVPGTVQYGTPATTGSIIASPGLNNPEVSTPTGITVTTTMVNDPRPVVHATFAMPGSYGEVRFVNTATKQVVLGVGDTVAGFQPAIPLQPGTYTVSISAKDGAQGNKSAIVPVIVPGSTSGAYIVEGTMPGTPTPTSEVVAPTIAALPSVTGASTVTVTGTVPSNVSLVLTVNGALVSTQSVGSADTTYSLVVHLTANMQNTIELRSRTADGHESIPATARITQDSAVPASLAVGSIRVTSSTAGSNDTVSGVGGATEPGAQIEVYADQAMQMKIGSATAGPDGSFSAISLGDNQYSTVYIRQVDLAGNAGPLMSLVNPISFANEPLKITVTFPEIKAEQITVRVEPVKNAVNYLVKYRKGNGAYSNPMLLCNMSTGSCNLQTTLIGLTPESGYSVALAAIDVQGGQSQFTEIGFQTQAIPVTISTQPAPAAPVVVEQPVAPVRSTRTVLPAPSTSPTIAPTATPTITPTDTPSPVPGDVESASTTRNWTPWIILIVLIALALLATIGYFYWFGPEVPEGETVASTAPKPQDPPPTSSTQDTTPKEKRPESREKRW